MSQQIARRLAWSIAVFSALLVMVGLVISILALIISGRGVTFSHQFFTPLLTITYCVVGALVASRHHHNPIGWIFCAIGFLSALNMLSAGYALYSELVIMTGSLPGAAFARWLSIWIWIPNVLLPITFTLLLFPDGKLLSPRWRPIAWAAVLSIAAFTTSVAFYPGPLEGFGLTDANPFAISGSADIMTVLMTAAAPLLLVGIFGSIASIVVRFRKAIGRERAQLKWLTVAAVLVIAGNILGGIPWLIWADNPIIMELSIVITDITIINIVIATGFAILRYQLWDIHILINRTLVYGSLTALVVAIYILIVGSLGTFLQSGGSLPVSLIGTGIVAISFQPLRERLQRAVNRLMYGERDDPVTVLSRLGQRLEATITPEAMLVTIVETVAQALKLPYVALEIPEGEAFKIAAAYGQPVPNAFHVPLIYQHQMEMVGQFVIAPRAVGEGFSSADQRLLENIAHRAGAAVHTVRLTADLQHSRQGLVTAREEERRRLRRDLHDGLGPALATLSLQAEAACDLLHLDPHQCETLLKEVIAGTQAAIQNIRRVVYALRPPALDDLGLVSALQEQVTQYMHNGLNITLDAPATLPPLPAAVEVAAYRIVQEALTNVVRHAEARTCTVCLRVNGTVELTIHDDGCGIAVARRAGVGLNSMHERAAELGGTCHIQSSAGTGTSISITLPRHIG